MAEQDPDKMTSEEIFLQYCMAKPKKAMEFMDDYILYLLKIENPFETEKYSKDEFVSLFKEDLDSSVIDFAYNFFIANLNNLQFLRSKKSSEFFEDEIINYKTNLQMNFGHSSIANEEPDFNVLLKIVKNKGKSQDNILEINDKELDGLINKLKDIYGQIKS